MERLPDLSKAAEEAVARLCSEEPDAAGRKNIPVVLMVYNRPKHTLEVLNALKKHGIKNLYVFADAPKKEEHKESVAQVRRLIRDIDWTMPRIIERKVNFGLARSIVCAVDYVFEREDRLILFEDDCVPQEHFFDFVGDCLEKYKDNSQVFGVSGFSVKVPERILKKYPYDAYFCPRICSWGWATWKRAWQYYGRDLRKLVEEANEKGIDLAQGGSEVQVLIERFLKGESRDVWTLNWVLSVYLNKGFYVYPTHSHVENLGMDGSGLHCPVTNRYNGVLAEEKPARYPEQVVLNESILENFKNYFQDTPERSRQAAEFISTIKPQKTRLFKDSGTEKKPDKDYGGKVKPAPEKPLDKTGSVDDARPHSDVKAKGPKGAADYVSDGMKVDTQSCFGNAIKELFKRITPQKLIETGTYLGTGTTTIIANALKELGIRDAVFSTIEVNPEYHARATEYFRRNNISVYALNGLSVPRSMLPSRQDIERKTIADIKSEDIFVDHREQDRARLYHKETDFPNVPDNLLYKCIEVFEFRPDFVLLDSDGCIGSIEFDYLIEHLKGRCYIAIRDICHTGHSSDFLKMQSDRRFEIVTHSEEKFGFCIARFTPNSFTGKPANGSPTTTQAVLNSAGHPGDCGKRNLAGLSVAEFEEFLHNKIGVARNHRDVADVLELLTPDKYLPDEIRAFRNAENKDTHAWIPISVLNAISKHFKIDSYLEIGVRRGRSLAQVLSHSPEAGVYAFDLWMKDYAGAENPGPEFVQSEMERVGYKKKINFFSGDSAELVPKFFRDADTPKYFDLIYVDGDHSYQGALKDLRNVVGRLKPGGVFVFDDVNHPQHKYLDEVWNLVKAENPNLAYYETSFGYGLCIAFNKQACCSDGRPFISNNCFENVAGTNAAVCEAGQASKEKHRVLIVRPDAIGDFVLFADTIRYFKKLYENAELHIIVQEHVAELAQGCPDIDLCIKFDAKLMQGDDGYFKWVISQLRGQQYEAAIYTVYSRTALGDRITLECGAKKTIALDGDCSNMSEAVKRHNDACYTRLVPVSTEWGLETEKSEEFVRALGIEPDGPVTPVVWLADEDFVAAEELLAELDVENPVVLCPFGQNDIRCWPTYKWAQLLAKYKQHDILICGAESNGAEADEIIRMSGHQRMYNLCGKTGLRQLAAIFTMAKLCVGVESAAGHIAAAVGCPHVIIIGGGHFGRFMPYSPLSMLVYLPTKCYRCNWLCRRKFRESFCITQISVSTVDKALKRALKTPRNKWAGPVLIEEDINRDFISQKPLEIGPEELADIDLSRVDKHKKYLVTAIISTYNSEKYIEGCIENLESQTIAGRLEIIVVDSASPQNEKAIVERLQKKYDNIKYLRTKNREPIFMAWNRAIKQAKGKYLISANTDDRLRNDSLEYMVKVLEKRPDAAMVYSDQDWFDDVDGNFIKEFLTPEFSRLRLLSADWFLSSNPVWRKSVHKEFGYFEEDILCCTGDWEFWLRVSQKHDFIRLKGKFGFRRFAPDCFSRVHLESRKGLGHLDNEVIYKAYHYASQYGLLIDSRGISGNKLFSDLPQTKLLEAKTRAKYENRQFNPADNVKGVKSFNIGSAPRLSIIITMSPRDKVSKQGLVNTLESLMGQSCQDFEVVVVNSGVKSHKPQRLAEKFGYALVWIDLASDFGHSFARNIALENSRGEYVAFFEQNSVADCDFAQNICNHFRLNDDIYALRGKVLPLNEECAGFAPEGAYLGDDIVRSFCENGANCAFRKTDLVAAGGFDDDLFSKEFVELSYRLFVEKKRPLDGILYFPDIVVYHDYAPLSAEESFERHIDSQISEMLMNNKWQCPELRFYVDLMRRRGHGNDMVWMIVVGYAVEEKWPDISKLWAEKVLQSDPRNVKAHYLRSSALLKLGKLDHARQGLEKNLEILKGELQDGLDKNEELTVNDLKEWLKLYGCGCIKLADCYMKTSEFGKLRTVYDYLLRQRSFNLAGDFRQVAGAILAKLEKIPPVAVPGIPLDADFASVFQKSISAAPVEPAPKVLPVRGTGGQPLVTAIVSTYNSQQFIRGCLEDLENQTIADRTEIIVVNSASQQDEEAIVKEFQKKYSNIVYIRTDKREGLYSAWNRAVKVASGRFITNANTDDRHRKDAFEIMANALLANPDIALVYGDQIVTDTPNGTFESHHAVSAVPNPEFSRQRLLFGCCVGSQPMWRKSLHDEFGGFDETLTAAGDWEFWLRIAAKYPFKHILEILGLYYRNEQGIEHGRKIHSFYERYKVGKRYGNPYISIIPLYRAIGNPLVSIVMPAYNAVDYIARAVESVLIQNYRNFELIVVDDGSTDRTADIIRCFENEPIKYFYRENGGVASSRNFGLQKCAGKFIIMLDSDDMMTPDYIARHLQEFERYPEADMVYCNDLLIDERDKPVRVIKRPEYTDPNALISDMFRCGFPVVHFKTCIRRSVFDKIGLYDERLIVAEDYDMMRRFAKQGLKMRHLPAALYLRRLTKKGSLSRNFNAEKARSHFDVIRRFTETFTPEQLFPDVRWETLPAGQKSLLFKYRAAQVFLGLGEQYIASGAPDYANTAYEMACAQLDECCKIEPQNHQVRVLREKCRAISSRQLSSGSRNICQTV